MSRLQPTRPERIGSRRELEKASLKQSEVLELPSYALHWPHLGPKVKGLQLLVKSLLLPARVASGCPAAKLL